MKREREREIRKAEEGENHKLLLQCNDDVFISENIHKSSAFSDATGPIFTNQHNEIRQKNNIRVVVAQTIWDHIFQRKKKIGKIKIIFKK